jgi:hypothetical protein
LQVSGFEALMLHVQGNTGSIQEVVAENADDLADGRMP